MKTIFKMTLINSFKIAVIKLCNLYVSINNIFLIIYFLKIMKSVVLAYIFADYLISFWLSIRQMDFHICLLFN